MLLTHVCGAFMVALTLSSAIVLTLRRYPGETYLARPAHIAAALLVVQLSLGIAAYVARLGSPSAPQPRNPMVGITVAHVACGALVFAATIVLTLRAFRVLKSERARAGGYRKLSAETS